MALSAPDVPPILFDMGTGARHAAGHGPFDGVCLLGHLHWDHVQGLPFFPPLLSTQGRLQIFAPPTDDGRHAGEALRAAMCPPLFPVGLDALPGTLEFHDAVDGEMSLGAATVMMRSVPHVGPTVGFRVDTPVGSVAYVSDHQQPANRQVPDGVRELCDGVDVLIHDAQYTDDEFASRAHWGHSTYGFALHVAQECSVGSLVLFHHDPNRHDDDLDRYAHEVTTAAGPAGPQIVVAVEGRVLEVGR